MRQASLQIPYHAGPDRLQCLSSPFVIALFLALGRFVNPVGGRPAPDDVVRLAVFTLEEDRFGLGADGFCGAQFADIGIQVTEEEGGGRVDFGTLCVAKVDWGRGILNNRGATAGMVRGGEVGLADLAQVRNEG